MTLTCTLQTIQRTNNISLKIFRNRRRFTYKLLISWLQMSRLFIDILLTINKFTQIEHRAVDE